MLSKIDRDKSRDVKQQAAGINPETCMYYKWLNIVMLPELHHTAQQPEQNMLSCFVTVIVQLVVDLDSMTVLSQ